MTSPRPGTDLAVARAVYVRKLEAAERRLADVLAAVEGIQRVSVFGSYARGRRDLGTDLDVLVVWETEKPFVERLRALYTIADVGVDLDLVCYTPAEFRELRDQPFLRHVRREAVVLFEKRPA
jgi:uncharacterized protein